MKKGNIIALIFLILSAFGIGVFLILPLILILILIASTASIPSIGIIGGADGPTAVLVTSSLYSDIFFFAGAVVSIVIFILSIVYLIKNNRKSDIKSRKIKENSK